MLTKCAWCKKVIREGDEKDGVSHGICVDCLRIMEKECEAVKEHNAKVGKKEIKK